MKLLTTLAAAAMSLALVQSASARDDAQRFPISTPMSTETAKSYDGVQFFFGDAPHPAVAKRLGTYSSRRNTNAFGKSDEAACDWAFLSAVKSFWERAQSEGGNAVINLRSITTGETVSSSTEYVCRAGNVVAKVYLEGTVVVLE
ncbi:MAG: excinuclease ABC subunit A [Gammaproteobacteria bacterium]|nr:excinuclease ABC subunit A [Gammaproteobacteria bacterium]